MDEPIPHDVLKMRRYNILEMEMPETYQCGIKGYKATHSKLQVSVHKKVPGDTFDLVFTGAYFYDGPTQWIGANFCVAPRDEWLTLMRELGWIEGAPQDAMDYLSEELRLFTVESQRPKYKIRIVAANVHKSHNRSEGFGR